MKYVSERLIKTQATIYDYLDARTVKALIMEHLEGRTNRRLLIWSLLSVEEYLNSQHKSDHA